MLKKHLKTVFKIFIGIFIIVTVLALVKICLFLYDLFAHGLCHEYTNPKHYQEVLCNVREPEGIIHFPNVIPKNAKDINFYSFSGAFYHQRIFLEFGINKNYIEQEMKKLDLLSTPQPKNTNDILGIQRLEQAKTEANINTDRYTYYAINNERNRHSIKCNSFPYFNGIWVDKNHTRIFYYFNNPEG